jgi:hypothetical protein
MRATITVAALAVASCANAFIASTALPRASAVSATRMSLQSSDRAGFLRTAAASTVAVVAAASPLAALADEVSAMQC